MIGLPDHTLYTGHCWRRTTATLAASKGMTIPQIKQITGHRSDTVVQNYIDSSIYTKNKASEMLAVVDDDEMGGGGGHQKKNRNSSYNQLLPSNNKYQKKGNDYGYNNQQMGLPQIVYNLTIQGDVRAPMCLGWSHDQKIINGRDSPNDEDNENLATATTTGDI
eukprot:gene17577-24402_t